MDPRDDSPAGSPSGERPDPLHSGATGREAGPDNVGRHTIEGERTIPSVNRARTVQSRIGNAVALGVLGLLGIAFLYWYYSSTFAAQRQAAEREQRAREARAAGDMRPPRLSMRQDPGAGAPRTAAVMPAVAPGPAAPAPVPALSPPPMMPAGPPAKSAEDLERERLLGAGVMLHPPLPGQAGVASTVVLPGAQQNHSGGEGVFTVPGAATPAGGALAQSLRPTPTPAVRAQVLPDRRFLLPKGAFIDCTLETALDSTLPGLATCIAPVDIFSADGTIVLIERGTRFVGETRADVRPGQSRIGVLWNEARTPLGVSVALASPGTDELGRTGLPGHVNRHFWERFGAAILISVVDGVVQGIANSQGGGTTGPVYNTGTPRDVMSEVLRGTIAIPPTVVKNQGERIQILVARDVDFRTVYALRDVER